MNQKCQLEDRAYCCNFDFYGPTECGNSYHHSIFFLRSCRHPIASSRPTFSEILTGLLKDEVLSIPAEDQTTHPQASLLGASLEAGLEMYKDLQNTYLSQQSSSPSPKTKKYTTTEKQRVAPVKSQSREAVGSGDDRWSQTQGQYEMEEEAETASSGYQNVDVAS